MLALLGLACRWPPAVGSRSGWRAFNSGPLSLSSPQTGQLMKKTPNLILLSLFWSLLLAFVMTLIGFMHHDMLVDLNDAAGGVDWSRVFYLFFGWFAFSELVMLVGGLLYAVSMRFKQRGRN